MLPTLEAHHIRVPGLINHLKVGGIVRAAPLFSTYQLYIGVQNNVEVWFAVRYPWFKIRATPSAAR